jgi:PAS domain S-box-containing protein
MQSVDDGLLLRELVNGSETILAAVSMEGVLVACSEAICRNAGRPREELVGKRLSDLRITFPIHTPEQWHAAQSKLERDGELAVETEFGKIDGSTYRARVLLSLQEARGERYVLAVGHKIPDSTPLRAELEREARWRKAQLDMATHPSIAAGEVRQTADFICELVRGVLPAPECRVLKRGAPWVEAGSGEFRCTFEEFAWLVRELDQRAACDLFEIGKNDRQRNEARGLAKRSGMESVMLAPVRVAGEVWGVFILGSPRTRQWTQDELAFAAEAATHMGHCVLNEARNQVEQELRASEKRFRTFMEMSQELVWRVEFDQPVPMDLPIAEQAKHVLANGYLADCNDSLARFFGLTHAEELHGVRLTTILAPVDESRWAELHMMAESGFNVKNVPIRHYTRGQEQWLLRSSQGIFENGKMVQLWGAARDISERKRVEDALVFSEERYRAFITNSSEGIFRIEYPDPVPIDLPPEVIVDRCWYGGRLAECNHALVKLRGYKGAEEMLGRPSTEFRMLTRDEWQQELDFVLGGFRISGVERPIRTASGSVKWFRYSAIGIVGDGKISGVWGTVSDVTERKLLEEELRLLSSRNTTILEQERARVAREIHDELGQQLTVLKFEASAWESGKRKPTPGGLTKEIDTAIQTVRRIATQLRPVILDQYGLAAAIEWQANEFARRTGIACECTLDAAMTVPDQVATPAFRIFQESLTNVARHAGASKVEVEMRREQGALHLEVRDNGRGLPAEGGRAASLGLAGMRERALDAGGTVTFHVAPGGGTQMIAVIPVEESA